MTYNPFFDFQKLVNRTLNIVPAQLLNEPSHDTLVFLVLRKLILQTCMRSHPVELDVWFLVGPFIYFHTSHVQTAKARMRRLARAFAGGICDKYHNLMSWLKYLYGVKSKWCEIENVFGLEIIILKTSGLYVLEHPLNLHVNWTSINLHVNWTSINLHVNWTAINLHVNWTSINLHVNWTSINLHVNWASINLHVNWTSINLHVGWPCWSVFSSLLMLMTLISGCVTHFVSSLVRMLAEMRLVYSPYSRNTR